MAKLCGEKGPGDQADNRVEHVFLDFIRVSFLVITGPFVNFIKLCDKHSAF
jgi:hypothetical protein